MNPTIRSVVRRARRVLLALSLTAAAGHAAAIPAVTLDNTTGLALGNPPYTLGWSFTTNSAVTVTALGLFDHNQDGLAERHEIGLWNSSGTLLASTILGAGTAEPLTNQFRYASIIGTLLAANETYTIGALFTSGADPLIFPGSATNFATAAAINFGENRFEIGGSLANPIFTAGTAAAYFGPNFLFTTNDNGVPEPVSVLLVGLALAGLATSRAFSRR